LRSLVFAKSVARTSVFEVRGSYLDSLARTPGEASVFEILGFCEGRAADPKNGGPRYTLSAILGYFNCCWTRCPNSNTISSVSFDLMNALTFFVSPLLLIGGWVQYFNLPRPSDWRLRASLLGLSAPLLSIAVWIATLLLAQTSHWTTSNPTIHHLIAVGVWIPLVGLVVGLAGRPRLILFIVPCCIATVWFWFGTTLP